MDGTDSSAGKRNGPDTALSMIWNWGEGVIAQILTECTGRFVPSFGAIFAGITEPKNYTAMTKIRVSGTTLLARIFHQ